MGRSWLGLLLAHNFPRKFLSLSRQRRDEHCWTCRGDWDTVDVPSPTQNLAAPLGWGVRGRAGDTGVCCGGAE